MRSIDPAVREIEQTRVLAERTIFYLQRAPSLLDMQIERLVYQLAVMPETKQTLNDVTKVALASEAIGALSSNAPEIIATQRQAIIEEFKQAFAAEQTRLSGLLSQINHVLESGAAVSASVGDTVQAVDGLVHTFRNPSNPVSQSAQDRRPFDVTEYITAMRELTTSARELHGLLEQVDASSTSVEHLTAATIRDVRALTDHVYWQIISLFLLLAAIVIVGTLLHRHLDRRLALRARRQFKR
jgi:hypothetical protein